VTNKGGIAISTEDCVTEIRIPLTMLAFGATFHPPLVTGGRGGDLESGERVDDLEARLFKVAPVPGGDRELVHESRGRDQAVLDRHGEALRSEIGEKPGPAQTCGRFPGKAVDTLDSVFEPALQPCTALPARQQEDAVADLAEDDRID